MKYFGKKYSITEVGQTFSNIRVILCLQTFPKSALFSYFLKTLWDM